MVRPSFSLSKTRTIVFKLAALQQQNDYLKTDNESYKRLLLDAQKGMQQRACNSSTCLPIAIETLKSGAFHSARLKCDF